MNQYHHCLLDLAFFLMFSSCKKAYPNPFYCHFGLSTVKLWISFPQRTVKRWISFPLTQCKINLKNKINSPPTFPIFYTLGKGNRHIFFYCSVWRYVCGEWLRSKIKLFCKELNFWISLLVLVFLILFFFVSIGNNF